MNEEQKKIRKSINELLSQLDKVELTPEMVDSPVIARLIVMKGHFTNKEYIRFLFKSEDGINILNVMISSFKEDLEELKNINIKKDDEQVIESE